jgi:ferredoxin-NADP reductase
VLLAGGIGITPILCMAERLSTIEGHSSWIGTNTEAFSRPPATVWQG